MESSTFSVQLPFPATQPFIFDLRLLTSQFASLPDRRARRGVRYPLAVLLTIAVLAKLAGAHRPEDLAHWAQLRAAELTRWFGLPRQTMPHAGTWRRIFAVAIDPVAFNARLSQFFQTRIVTAEIPARASHVLALDGKTLRGTVPAGSSQGVHLLAVYRPDVGVVLAQTLVPQKTNEITAAPSLLTTLDLTGMVVTGDPLHCQQPLSAQIVAAGGDYLWFVKDNQPTLHADIQQVFAPIQHGPGWAEEAPDWTTAVVTTSGHGRIEERRITVSSMLAGYSRWPGLAQVFQLERRSWDGQGRESIEVRYGVTSVPLAHADARRVLALAQAHWGIENGLHYRRDVTLREDAMQFRRGQGPAVLAAINNAVIGIAQWAGFRNVAAALRAFAAAIDRAIFALPS
jgi:predicted transposase YbfD/YdcC